MSIEQIEASDDNVLSTRQTETDKRVRVINATRSIQLGDCVETADRGAQRRRGLLGRATLLPGEGLWIIPCEAVHTFAMQFPIDLVYINRDREVKKTRTNVRPWRMSGCITAHSVIELPAGTIARTGTQSGDTLLFFPSNVRTDDAPVRGTDHPDSNPEESKKDVAQRSWPWSLAPSQYAAATPGFFALWACMLLLVLAFGSIFISGAGRSSDFRAFYSAGELVRQHPDQLYDLAAQETLQNAATTQLRAPMPFYHPSYEALLYAPLSVLSYRLAYLVYLGWNMLLLGACYFLAPPAASEFVRKFPRPLLFLLFFPVLLCLLQGQNSILFLTLICLVWRTLQSGKDFTAGVLLGLALFKVQLVLTICALVVARRGRRFLFGFASAGAAIGLLCLLITGPHGAAQFMRLVYTATRASEPGVNPQQVFTGFPSAMPSLYGLLYSCGARYLSERAGFRLGAVLSVAVFLGCFHLVRKVRDLSTAFCIALLCALLLSHHILLYDYTSLLLPMLLLKGRWALAGVVTSYVGPIVILAIFGSYWFSIAALLPIALLGLYVHDERAPSVGCVDPTLSKVEQP